MTLLSSSSSIRTRTAMAANKYADMLAIAATASSGVFTGVLPPSTDHSCMQLISSSSLVRRSSRFWSYPSARSHYFESQTQRTAAVLALAPDVPDRGRYRESVQLSSNPFARYGDVQQCERGEPKTAGSCDSLDDFRLSRHSRRDARSQPAQRHLGDGKRGYVCTDRTELVRWLTNVFYSVIAVLQLSTMQRWKRSCGGSSSSTACASAWLAWRRRWQLLPCTSDRYFALPT